MNRRKRRGLTWALVVIAALTVALGVTLALTASSQGFPAWDGMHGRRAWAQGGTPGQAPSPGNGPGRDFFRDGRGLGPRFGPGYGPGFRAGHPFGAPRPMMALGGLCILGLAGLVGLVGLVLVAGALRHGRSHHHPEGLGYGHLGAIEILKAEFASGKISADEYRARLAVLKE